MTPGSRDQVLEQQIRAAEKPAVIRIRIEDDLKATAMAAARARGRSLSQHVRELLREELGRATKAEQANAATS
jgi:predicted HicB family RNase H-like nuclease